MNVFSFAAGPHPFRHGPIEFIIRKRVSSDEPHADCLLDEHDVHVDDVVDDSPLILTIKNLVD